MHKARTWNSLVNNERKVGGDTNMMKYLQKLGKALMLPVAALPVAGILMGVGYLLAPAVMGAAGDTTGFAYTAVFCSSRQAALLSITWPGCSQSAPLSALPTITMAPLASLASSPS